MMMPGSQSHYTSLFTTISGLIGGLGKAITYKPMLASITFSGLSHGGYLRCPVGDGGLCGEVRHGSGSCAPAQVFTGSQKGGPGMRKVLQFSLIGVAVYGVYRLLQMKNVSDLVTVRLIKPRIHKVDMGGLVFQTEVAINNPTRDADNDHQAGGYADQRRQNALSRTA
jgi:hypothetical protein